MKKYLFILASNQCGSTFLIHSLALCKNIVSFPVEHARHLQDFIREGDDFGTYGSDSLLRLNDYVKMHVWTEHTEWLMAHTTNWDKVKKTWETKWGTNPKAKQSYPIFIEKHTSSPIQAELLQKHFENSYFIIMVRNPYTVVEGIRRRQGLSIDRCAKHAVEVLNVQYKNTKILDNFVYFKYEDLIHNTTNIEKQIQEILPELTDINLNQPVYALCLDGYKKQSLVNFDQRKLNNLSTEDKATIKSIISKPEYEESMKFFNYSVDPPND